MNVNEDGTKARAAELIEGLERCSFESLLPLMPRITDLVLRVCSAWARPCGGACQRPLTRAAVSVQVTARQEEKVGWPGARTLGAKLAHRACPAPPPLAPPRFPALTRAPGGPGEAVAR
jgi:hypothetical protein